MLFSEFSSGECQVWLEVAEPFKAFKISINQSKDMNILHGYPVYRADAGAVSPDLSHPEIRWRCSRNINLVSSG